MIPVEPRPEPASFHRNVREPGRMWMERNGFDPEVPAPRGTRLEPHWRACLDDLWEAYDGTCAYLGIFFERQTGTASVDHFVAKSQSSLRLAYEWSNFRLACQLMNQHKRDFAGVLDPFEVRPGMFHLELATGRIFPNPELPDEAREQVRVTIFRLGLDTAEFRRMRQRHFDEWLRFDLPAEYMQAKYPFLWQEIARQRLPRRSDEGAQQLPG